MAVLPTLMTSSAVTCATVAVSGTRCQRLSDGQMLAQLGVEYVIQPVGADAGDAAAGGDDVDLRQCGSHGFPQLVDSGRWPVVSAGWPAGTRTTNALVTSH